MSRSIIIKAATPNDINGIIKLEAANQNSQGGALSGDLTTQQIQEMMADMPQIVTTIDNEIIGSLLTISEAVNNKRKGSYCRRHEYIL
jgi:hypothetical protein